MLDIQEEQANCEYAQMSAEKYYNRGHIMETTVTVFIIVQGFSVRSLFLGNNETKNSENVVTHTYIQLKDLRAYRATVDTCTSKYS